MAVTGMLRGNHLQQCNIKAALAMTARVEQCTTVSQSECLAVSLTHRDSTPDKRDKKIRSNHLISSDLI